VPSIAELRPVAQPDGLLQRLGQEHWAGRLYMRRVSLHVTRLLVATPLSANAVTFLMIPVGLLAGFVLSLPGLAAAIGAALLAQLWLLLDCCDGEVARWRQTFSPTGPYLDALGHYAIEAALPIGLGIRADGGWDSIGGWTALGLTVSVFVLLLKAESSLVIVTRAKAGHPAGEGIWGDRESRPEGRRLTLREGARLLPFLRPFYAIEATLLALAAAIVDTATDSLDGSRVLLVALVVAGAVAVVGHLASILVSDRLR
jgi:phosphatidylglycerophosphate synthase